MSESLGHRGPDARRNVRLAQCHLGHTRLSIIDLEGGHQPMRDESGRFWIVFNGEIYNFRELRAKLEKLGKEFRTQSDTEVLLAGYEQFGEKVLERLNGQFAFVIWDELEKKVFAARDRLGEKPFYWAESAQGHLLIASELKAILASGMLEPRLDLGAVDAYLRLLYVPPERSIYENVRTLPPAHAAVWQAGGNRQWRYWTPSYSGARKVELGEVIENLRFLMEQAVRRQMVADVPVGAFLSGGLDSSTIVALMTGGRRVRTFSVGFGELINELPYARAVAEAHGTEHKEIQMEIPVDEMAVEMARVYDEPLADSSNIPTYLMARFAREHVKVVLGGDGADELFGGYDWYEWLLQDEGISSGGLGRAMAGLEALSWKILRRAGVGGGRRAGEAMHKYHRGTLKKRHPSIRERHLAQIDPFRKGRERLWGGRKIEAEWEYEGWKDGGELEGMDGVTDFDLRNYLPGDILVKVDRAGMAHGLETRAPFLDVDLVEYVLRLPWRTRFQEGSRKYLLRESFRAVWPETVRNRSKQGFGAPLWSWVERREVRSLLDRVCSPSHPLSAVLPNVGKGLRGESPQGRWTILCLGLWLENRSSCLRGLS